MRLRVLVTITVLITLSWVFTTIAHARIVRSWTLTRLSKEAEALCVGEVQAVVVSAKLEKNDTHWSCPLLRKTATIKVIRTCATAGLNPGENITLEFLSLDPDRPTPLFDGPTFPNLIKGQLYIFPLRKDKAGKWELSDEEDYGLLAPAVLKPLKPQEIDPLKVDVWIKQLNADEIEVREAAQKQLIAAGASGLAALKVAMESAKNAEVKQRISKIVAAGSDARLNCLRAEIAAVWVHGDVQTMHRLAQVFRYGDQADDATVIAKLIEEAVGRDEPRWLQIALSLYAGIWTEQPWPMLTFPKNQTDLNPRLLEAALAHISPAGLDERITREVFSPGRPYTDSVKLLKDNNLAGAPLTQELLSAALKAARADAVAMTFLLQPQRQKTDAIAIVAVGAALKVLATQKDIEQDHFYFACHVIIDWGEERDIASLYEQFKLSQKADPEKHIRIWEAVNWTKSPNVIRFASDMLNDTSLRKWGDMRNCDMAVYTLQYSTDQKFGIEPKQTVAERDKGVEKAKTWIVRQQTENLK